MNDALLCYCRAGFEPELAAELTERAGELGYAGYARTERGSGFVRAVLLAVVAGLVAKLAWDQWWA